MKTHPRRAMTRPLTAPVFSALALALLTPLGAAGAAQQTGQGEGESEQGPPAPELPPLQEQTENPQQDIQKEMIKLFHTVERKLEQVDMQLTQAGTGVLPLDAPADAGLDDLLRGALRSSQDLADDIDRMLELAQKMGGMQQQQSQAAQQGQSGQPQSNPGGDSPIDSRNQGDQQSREQTLEGPQQEGGKQPGQESDKKDGDKQDGDGEDQNGKDKKDDPNGDDPNGKNPDSDRDNPDSGSNRPGEEQAGAGSAKSGASGDANRWGELPVRVREVFRNQGREDLPVQYRDWIDAYYRRLNKVDR